MKRFIDSSPDVFPEDLFESSRGPESFVAEAIPAAHPAEPDLFARHDGIPGHNQVALAGARILLVGAGGLNSWAAAGLARSGAGTMIIADDDLVDRTNLSRQLYFGDDLGQRKGLRLARNVAVHAVGGARITGLTFPVRRICRTVSDSSRHIGGRRGQ